MIDCSARHGASACAWLAILLAGLASGDAGAFETLHRGRTTVRPVVAGEAIDYRFAGCTEGYFVVEIVEDGIDVDVEWKTESGRTLRSDDIGIPRHGIHRLAAAVHDCAEAALRVKSGAAPAGRVRLTTTRFATAAAADDARLALALRETETAQAAAGDAGTVRAWSDLAAAWSALGEWRREAECEFRAGLRAARAHDRSAAARHYASAAAAARKAGDSRLELWARNDRAMLAWRAGEGAEAGEALVAVSRDAERIDDPLLQATVLNNACLTGRLHTDLLQARRCYERALSLSRRSGDARRIGTALNNLGGARLLLGDSAAAGRLFAESLSFKREAGDRAGEADSEFNLGWIATSEGRPDDALPRLRRALELYGAEGAARGEARTLGQIANLQELLGARAAARASATQALAKLRQVGGGNDEAFILLALARLATNPAERNDFLAQASARADASGLMDARYQAHIARVRSLIDDADAAAATAALHDGNARLALANPDWKAASALAEARIAILRGDWKSAGERLASARESAKHRPNPLLASDILLATGEVAYAQRRYADADLALAQSAAIVEPMRTRIIDAAARARFGAEHLAALRLRLDVLMHRASEEPGRGFERAALLLADAERSRSLREAITAAPAQAGDRDRFADINALALAAAQARANGDERALDEIRSRLAAAEGKLAVDALRKATGESAGRSTRSEASDGERLHALRESVGDDRSILFFAFGRDRAYAWRIDAGGMRSRVLGPASHVRQIVVRAVPAMRGDDGADAAAADELGALLLAPDDPVPRKLVLVPDDALRGVPFAALPAGTARQPLLDLAEIEIAPSLSIRRELARRGGGERGEGLLIVADPVLRRDDIRFAQASAGAEVASATRSGIDERLYASSREAGAIAELAARSMPVTRLEGFDATRERVLPALSAQPRIVHFATHAVVDRDAPDATGLVLSQLLRDGSPATGYLGLRDIGASRLPHGLVVLSACSTATGADFDHEGTWGLVQAFMLAGSNEVVASLWDVSDGATSELMRFFYEGVLVERISAPAALREAQRKLRAAPRYRSPKFWAPFFVSG